MVVDALSFVFSAHMTNRVRVTERPPTARTESLVRRPAGVRIPAPPPLHGPVPAVMRNPQLLQLRGGHTGPPLRQPRQPHPRPLPGTIGLAFGVGAVGGLIGALLAGRIARRLHHRGGGGAVQRSVRPRATGLRPRLGKGRRPRLVEAISGFGSCLTSTSTPCRPPPFTTTCEAASPARSPRSTTASAPSAPSPVEHSAASSASGQRFVVTHPQHQSDNGPPTSHRRHLTPPDLGCPLIGAGDGTAACEDVAHECRHAPLCAPCP
jgi:hypothetical protein